MKKTILDLWYGNVDPQEHRDDDPRISDVIKIMGRNREELSNTLNEKQKEILEKYDDALNEINCFTERSIFVYAFRLGMRLAIESLSEENEIID